ncbi:MAG: hotdog domain-containing protein [Planctomycetota bacterium]|nr:hotdog domain-containing protein [Planctomycetota bacterium]
MSPEPPPENQSAAPLFRTDQLPAIRRVMVPQDTNAMGTIFGGAILSDIDLAAAICAHRHHAGKVVTVAMDKVEFKKPVFVGDVMTIFAETLSVGTTSISVKTTVFAERALCMGRPTLVTEAQVTMVAVNEDFKPVPIERPKQ